MVARLDTRLNQELSVEETTGPAEPFSPNTREAAFLDLFEARYTDLCRLATLLLSDSHRAEDIVQEAFLRAFSGWGNLRHPERADAYVRRSVVNLCRSGLRHRLVEARGNARVAGQPQARGWDSDGTGTSLAVLEAIRALPTRQRTAVVLRYYADLSESDMAETMGCSVGTIKSQLAKARAAVARSLGEAGSVEEVGGGRLPSDQGHEKGPLAQEPGPGQAEAVLHPMREKP